MTRQDAIDAAGNLLAAALADMQAEAAAAASPEAVTRYAELQARTRQREQQAA